MNAELPIVALLIPCTLSEPMKPVRIGHDIATMYPLLHTRELTMIPARKFENCGLWVDADILNTGNLTPNLRGVVLAGIAVYGDILIVSHAAGNADQFLSWEETNPLPFQPCVLQGFSQAVANSDAGMVMVAKMVEEVM